MSDNKLPFIAALLPTLVAFGGLQSIIHHFDSPIIDDSNVSYSTQVAVKCHSNSLWR